MALEHTTSPSTTLCGPSVLFIGLVAAIAFYPNCRSFRSELASKLPKYYSHSLNVSLWFCFTQCALKFVSNASALNLWSHLFMGWRMESAFIRTHESDPYWEVFTSLCLAQDR